MPARATIVVASIAALLGGSMLGSSIAAAQDQPKLFNGGQALPLALSADSVVPDELVIELDHVAARMIEMVGQPDAGIIGVPALDNLRGPLGVTQMRKLFAGSDPLIAMQRGLPDVSGWYVVRFDPNKSTLQAAIAAYRNNPHVKNAQDIGVHPVYAVPNDGNYPSQWHLNQGNDKDIDAPEAWNVETGDSSIIVAVLDTGVRYYHKDLGGSAASSTNVTATDGNIWINAAEKNGSAGVDDDANGYVDDWVGYDFVNGGTPCWSGEDCTTADNDPRDFNGHGTHCAGNVSAINNNGYATASPAGGWNSGFTSTGNGVKVMCLRMGWSGSNFGQEVGFVRMDFAASAFYYAANNGARIASCSWGSSNSGGIAAALDYFIGSGGLIFVAAGNSNNQSAGYLNSRSDCYSVAATNQSDVKSSFSSYGSWVDISAPGSAILSSYHNHADAAGDYVATLDGTSMATPLVASAAAAVWSRNPNWTAGQVWTQVRDTADNINSLNPSYVGLLGSGRINLFNAVNTSGGGFCGDGTCDPGENTCNCPQDCGAHPSFETSCSDDVDNDCDGLTDCDDPDCTGAPGCVVQTAVVNCITYTTSGNGAKNLHIAVQVIDGNGNAVPGAGVSISVTGQANGSSFTATGTTNASGAVTFTKNNAKNTCYSTNVTNVTASGFTFNGNEPSNGFRKGTDATPDSDCVGSSDPCG